ncbi:MAG: hypothetical protein IJP80_04235 [Bacteroidales bacterium]|nr:hypothetical protein [Bacteroidales bacterium]
MKMLGDLFEKKEFVVTNDEAGSVHCSASLMPVMDSPVLKAHFPGKPIVPGACILATVAELADMALGVRWQTREVKSVKFISLIEPEAGMPVLFDIVIDSPSGKVKASVRYRDAVCCKMSMTMGEDI